MIGAFDYSDDSDWISGDKRPDSPGKSSAAGLILEAKTTHISIAGFYLV